MYDRINPRLHCTQDTGENADVLLEAMLTLLLLWNKDSHDNCIRILELLIQLGADVNCNPSYPPLMIVAAAESVDFPEARTKLAQALVELGKSRTAAYLETCVQRPAEIPF